VTASPQAQDRLNSWKEIAAYLHVAVRTVQRWEKTERLPVRRHRHAAKSSVFAYKPELDSWWDGRPALRHSGQELPAARPSIAVLPFVNMSRSEADEVLSDGLTEELIGALTRVRGLHVIARTSSFHFKGTHDDVRTVAARLGVRTILEGSVRRSGERLRIAAQLIDATDGCHLWSERYDRRAEDLLDLQDEIARAITDALRVELIGPAADRQYPHDAATYELYLEGRYYWNKRTPQELLRAIACFERALARDPRMAAAWRRWPTAIRCGLVWPEWRQRRISSRQRPQRRGRGIDRNQAEAHAALGVISAVHEYDWAAAKRHFCRAPELNPEHANSHLLCAALVPLDGRLGDGERHMRGACELDPCSAVMQGALGMHSDVEAI
jgi:TolB-like protein